MWVYTSYTMVKKEEVVHSRIPYKLRQYMKAFIERDNYASESHFIRVAIKEKVERCGE